MQTEMPEVVASTFIEVAEQLTFMLAEEAEKGELEPPAGACLRTSMHFSGTLTGTFTLTVAESACAELAANILGVDEDEEEAVRMAVDALKETLNVAGGRIAREMGGPEAWFELTPPVVETLPTEAWSTACASPHTIGFMLDETPMLLGVATSAGGD